MLIPKKKQQQQINQNYRLQLIYLSPIMSEMTTKLSSN